MRNYKLIRGSLSLATLTLFFGLLFFQFVVFTTLAKSAVYPTGYNIDITYSPSALSFPTDESLIITRTVINNESFPLANLFLSDYLPAEFIVDSFTVSINDTIIPAKYIGPVDIDIVPGCFAYQWLIDEPVPYDPFNRLLLPGENLTLEYYLSCSFPGTYLLPLHTTCFFGNSTGFFETADPISIIVDGPDWICGDTNGDREINIFDITFFITHLYMSGPAPDPLESADVNHDGTVNIFDIAYLISFLYMYGPAPDCP